MSTHRLKYLSAQAGAYSALVLRNQHRVDEVVQEPSIVQRHFDLVHWNARACAHIGHPMLVLWSKEFIKNTISAI